MIRRQTPAQLREKAAATEAANRKKAAEDKAAADRKLHGKVADLIERFGRDAVIADVVAQVRTSTTVEALIERSDVNEVVRALVERNANGGYAEVIDGLLAVNGNRRHATYEIVQALVSLVSVKAVIDEIARLNPNGARNIAAMLPKNEVTAALTDNELFTALRRRSNGERGIAQQLGNEALLAPLASRHGSLEDLIADLITRTTGDEIGEMLPEIATATEAVQQSRHFVGQATETVEATGAAAAEATEADRKATTEALTAKRIADKAAQDATAIPEDSPLRGGEDGIDAKLNRLNVVAMGLNEAAEAAETARTKAAEAAKDAETALVEATEAAKGAEVRLSELIAEFDAHWAKLGRFAGQQPYEVERAKSLLVIESDEDEATNGDEEPTIALPAATPVADSSTTGTKAVDVLDVPDFLK